MSYQRVENVLNHAPSSIDATAKLALVAIAAKLPYPSNGRSVRLSRQDLARAMAVEPRAVRKSLVRLADAGIEVRVAVGKDKNGKPLFAHRGTVGQYVLPWFPPPTGCTCQACLRDATEGGADEPGVGVWTHPEAVDAESIPSRSEPKGGPAGAPLEGERGSAGPPYAGERGTRQDPLSEPKGGPGGPPIEEKGGPVGSERGSHRTPPTDTELPTDKSEERRTTSAQVVQTTARPVDPLRIIADALADKNPTTDEITAINEQWAATAKPRGTRLYGLIAEQGAIPWRTLLDDHRREARAATIAQLRRGPTCPHGDPGGQALHPDSGQPLCPHCRRGAQPVDDLGPDPRDTYRAIYRAAHKRDPDRRRMTAVARQAEHMRLRGADNLTVSAAATAAAMADQDLLQYFAAKDKISA